MAITALLTKRFKALRPVDQQSEEALDTIADGEVVRVEITRPSQRSIRHHNLFFALLQIVSEQVDVSVESLLIWCKIETGHADVMQDRHGKLTPLPRSISFARMSQDEFRAFFDAAVKAILDKLLPPGTPRHSIVQEVEERAALMSRRAA